MRACDYYVFLIKYETTNPERISTFGGMDSEPTGKYITEQRSYFVVAPSEAFARVAFARYHSRDKFLELHQVAQLNDLVYLQ